MNETDLCRQIREFLEINKLAIYRNNTGALKVGKSFVRYGVVGSPDFIGFDKKGRYVGIECKVGYNKQSKEQVAFQELCKRNNAIYILCYSLDECIEKLKKNEVI